MVAISWTEMQCPETGQIEQRKVAKVEKWLDRTRMKKSACLKIFEIEMILWALFNSLELCELLVVSTKFWNRKFSLLFIMFNPWFKKKKLELLINGQTVSEVK